MIVCKLLLILLVDGEPYPLHSFMVGKIKATSPTYYLIDFSESVAEVKNLANGNPKLYSNIKKWRSECLKPY